jgi:carbamoyl-phosphate synthase/aspartate carbamoyltransferase
MLGRMLLQKSKLSNGYTNGLPNGTTPVPSSQDWKSAFEKIGWVNPNAQNLVADGESSLICGPQYRADTFT